MQKGFKYRIYPTNEQIKLIGKTLGCCRLIYNNMLPHCGTIHDRDYNAAKNILAVGLKTAGMAGLAS